MSEEQPRYRLSIDFTVRNALFDFVELLKWGEFLPRDAEARRMRPGVLSEAPTEEYVVSTATDSPQM